MAETQRSQSRAPGLTSSQGTRSHMPQLGLHATTKASSAVNLAPGLLSQINEQISFKDYRKRRSEQPAL